jgi:hypothetical protein
MMAACAAGPTGSPEGPAATQEPAATKETAKVSIPDVLQGSWSASGAVPGPSGEPGLGWDMQVQLQDGKYVRTGYPAWDEHATIVRIERDKQVFTLHLTDHMRNGDAVVDEVVTLKLSKDGTTLVLDNFKLRK